MRDLRELRINEGERPATAGPLIIRQAPTEEQIRRFEAKFQVKLPAHYVSLLRFSNGGHPQIGTFGPKDPSSRERWVVNLFHFLSDDEADLEGVWASTVA